jgi:hypothetical protein
VFRSTGSGSFEFGNVDVLQKLEPAFDVADATFFLQKLANGPPALVGLVRPIGGQVAIVAARGNGAAGFAGARMDVLDLPRAESLEFRPTAPRSRFAFTDITHPERTGIEALVATGFSGRFANALHGNEHDDLGFLSRVGRTTVVAGACPKDPTPNPGPLKECTPSDPNALCPAPCPSAACTAAKKQCLKQPPCQDPPCSPGPPVCMAPCPDDCVLTPRLSFCESGATGLYIVVFRNTCSG